MPIIPQPSLASGYTQPPFANGTIWGPDATTEEVLLSSTNQLDNLAGRYFRYTADSGVPGSNNGAPKTVSADTTSTSTEGGFLVQTNSLSANFVPGGAGSDFSYVPNGKAAAIAKSGFVGVFLGSASVAASPGDYLAYKNADTSVGSNDAGTPVSYPKTGTPPTGYTKIPNAKLLEFVNAGGGLTKVAISKGNS